MAEGQLVHSMEDSPVNGLEAISDSLRRELSIYGIDVIVVEPGRIRTPIWNKLDGVSRFEGTDYGPALGRLVDAIGERMSSALPVESVSRVIVRALTHPRPRARYPIPDRWFSGWILPRLLPGRWLDRIIAGKLFQGGLRPRNSR